MGSASDVFHPFICPDACLLACLLAIPELANDFAAQEAQQEGKKLTVEPPEQTEASRQYRRDDELLHPSRNKRVLSPRECGWRLVRARLLIANVVVPGTRNRWELRDGWMLFALATAESLVAVCEPKVGL